MLVDADCADECAVKLCERSGFDDGTFVSGNSVCTSTDVPAYGTHWYWVANLGRYGAGSLPTGSIITARCTVPYPPPQRTCR